MTFEYEILTDDAKHSLITRRIQEMEQQHFEHGLTVSMLEAESAPEANAMAADARRTMVTLERGIGKAKEFRKRVPVSPPTPAPNPGTPDPRPPRP